MRGRVAMRIKMIVNVTNTISIGKRMDLRRELLVA
jgi:hypothetical protein